jgi:hypothetical protein
VQNRVPAWGGGGGVAFDRVRKKGITDALGAEPANTCIFTIF